MIILLCRVGLIDDIEDEYENYRYLLELRGITLLYMDYQNSYSKILSWILDNRIEVLLIDYKLDLLYEFNGAKLFQFINNNIPDLQCMLFTSNPEENDLVINRLKINKNVFNSDNELNAFADTLKDASRVFKNRLDENINDYKILLNKKENGKLLPEEEKIFFDLYNRLASYGIIDRIPERLLKSDFENAVDELIKNVEDYLKK